MPYEQSSPVRLPPFVLALDAINTAHINPATRVPPTASRNVGTLHLPPVGPTTKENEVSYSPLSVRDISMNDESINHTDLDSSSVLMASHTFNGGTRPPSAMMMDDLVNESVRRQREMSDSCGGSRVFDIDCSSCAAAMADLNSESPEVAAPVSPPRPISTNTQICPMSRDDLIIRGLKIAFRDLTGGFEVDELIDELCVRAAWATEDVMIHCFCLINRLTRRHPAWYAKTDSAVLVPTHYYTPEEDTSPSSSIDSNTSSSFTINNARSSTHAHNPQPPIFYRESYIRCFLAITSISMKFHGDTAYRLRSLCALTNNIRDRQLNEEAKRNNNNEASAQIHVLDPKRLSVCERRMWRELTATVWVHGREYDQCAAFVLRCAT